jgi:hypothetical protein
MTTSITIISPAMEVHVTGCADIAKTVAKRYSKATKTVGEMTANEYEGDTIVQAILAADEDLADWFCEEPYQANATAWTVRTSHPAPCFLKTLKGVSFGDDGRPVYTESVKRLAKKFPESAATFTPAEKKTVKRSKLYDDYEHGVTAVAEQQTVSSDFSAWTVRAKLGETDLEAVVNWDVARFSGRAWELSIDGQQYPTLKAAVESFIQEVRTREAFRLRFDVEGAEK